jgi:hypothetical protein
MLRPPNYGGLSMTWYEVFQRFGVRSRLAGPLLQLELARGAAVALTFRSARWESKRMPT